MRKFVLGIILVLMGAWGIILSWGHQHPVLFWTGVSIIGAIALGIVIWCSKKIAKFIGWAFSSILYLAVALVLVGLLAGYKIIPSLTSYCVTLVLGSLLMLMVIRNLASKATTSIWWGEIFKKVTGYPFKQFIKKSDKVTKVKIVEAEQEQKIKTIYDNVNSALKQLKFSQEEREEALTVALNEHPDCTQDELFRYALQNLNSSKIIKNSED